MIAHSEKATPTTSNMTQEPVLISTASLHGKVALVTGGSPEWPAEKVGSLVTGASRRDALYLGILPESWASWHRRMVVGLTVSWHTAPSYLTPS